jgi:hypothetical protein
MLDHAGRHRGPRDSAVDGGLRNEQGPSSDIMLADQRQDPSSNARAASLSSEAVPADLLTIRAPAPDWFRWAISHPGQSQFVMVAGCRIHYLHWAREPARPGTRVPAANRRTIRGQCVLRENPSQRARGQQSVRPGWAGRSKTPNEFLSGMRHYRLLGGRSVPSVFWYRGRRIRRSFLSPTDKFCLGTNTAPLGRFRRRFESFPRGTAGCPC